MSATHGMRSETNRGSHGRVVCVALCGALALVHAARVITVADDLPYLALLTAIVAVAATACAWQLARIDDTISWMCMAALGIILLAGYAFVLVFGLPGTSDNRATFGVVVSALISVALVVATAASLRGRAN
jgi:hypothetical protein